VSNANLRSNNMDKKPLQGLFIPATDRLFIGGPLYNDLVQGPV